MKRLLYALTILSRHFSFPCSAWERTVRNALRCTLPPDGHGLGADRRNRSFGRVSAILLCLLSLTVCNGCRESKKPKASSAASHAAAAAQYRNDLLVYAIDNLDQLEEFNLVVGQVTKKE